MTVDTNSYFGQTDPTSTQGDWNRLRFAIQQQILGLATSMPVQVLSVQASGLNPVGFVSIQILVDQITGDDKTVHHGEITNVPYFRLQGGSNAVIIDPEPGDIGIACFSSRDISAVKNIRANAPPGSRRAYDFSDAMYIGGFLNAAPTQYIQFSNSGIKIFSPTEVEVDAPNVTVNASTSANVTAPAINLTGTVNVNGGLNVTGNSVMNGTMTNNGKNIGSTHTHAGPPTAPNGPVSNTGQPV